MEGSFSLSMEGSLLGVSCGRIENTDNERRSGIDPNLLLIRAFPKIRPFPKARSICRFPDKRGREEDVADGDIAGLQKEIRGYEDGADSVPEFGGLPVYSWM